MKLYIFDENTKEYLFEDNAQKDPLETEIRGKDIFLLPANATFNKPLEKKKGFAIVFKNDKWEYVEDNRGKEYWKETDNYLATPQIVKTLGELDNGFTFIKPEMTKEEKKKIDRMEMQDSCRNSIHNLAIELDGLSFQADEESQQRMNKIVSTSVALGKDIKTEKTLWLLADNTVSEVTVEQLAKVCDLANKEQTKIVTTPYLSK